MTEQTIAIVDYGMGNLRSVEFAFDAIGVPAVRTGDPGRVADAAGIVLPGVGAFGDAMTTLRASGLADAIIDAAGRGMPILGVCLGMQLLASGSEEFGSHDGLGLVPGRVVALDPVGTDGAALKVPHISWARVDPSPGDGWQDAPLDVIAPGTYFYFVHSYRFVPDDPRLCTSTAEYGGNQFCASVAHRSIFGCQFHPERSGQAGLDIYARMFVPRQGQETG